MPTDSGPPSRPSSEPAERRRSGGPDFARLFWDAAYREDQDLEHWEGVRPDPALARAAGELEPGSGGRVLDLGCGRGGDARWLERRGLTVIALDLSVAALARARLTGVSGGGRLAGTAFELPLADRSVDWVVDSGCLHAIGRVSRPRYVRELERVTARGARFLVRGSAADREEEGLIAVDERECSRLLAPRWRVEWSMRLELPAASGVLEAVAVSLRRADGDGG